MNRDKDYKSEWHLRMQSYFPKETREHWFHDPDTGELHIADVYDPDTDTVIEFQRSPITEDEYLSRTNFHLRNGRRIVWIFDESRNKEEEGRRGKLKPDDSFVPDWKFNGVSLRWIYEDLSFKWMYAPRKCLSSGPDLSRMSDRYSVFLFTGEENDIVHRVISEECGYKYVVLSVCDTQMTKSMDPDQFFISERSRLSLSPWIEIIQAKKQELEETRARTEAYKEKVRTDHRVRERMKNHQSTELTRCPLCGGDLEVKTAKKGVYAGRKFYGCVNYPKCDFKEDFFID